MQALSTSTLVTPAPALANAPTPEASTSPPSRVPNSAQLPATSDKLPSLPPLPSSSALDPLKLNPQLESLLPLRPSGLQSLNLTEALELGLHQNPQMQVAIERIAQARATYEQQASSKNPKLILDNSTTIQPEKAISTDDLLRGVPTPASFPRRFVLVSPVTDQFRLSLQVLLSTFGKVEHAIAAAFLQIDVQEAAADVDRLRLTYDIKNAFFSKLKADAAVAVTRENLSIARQNLSDTQALFQQGVMSRYDVLQAEIEVTRSIEQLAQNLTYVDQSQVNLSNVLAEKSFYVQPIAPSSIDITPEVTLADLTHFALLQRPEMKVLTCQQAVTQKLLASAQAENRPTLTLAANYQTALGQSLAPVDVPSLTLQIQWQLFDGGYRKAKIAEIQSLLRSLHASLDKLASDIELQVTTTWLDLRQTTFNLDTAQQQLKNTIEYYDMARRRYLNGLATTLEVADAMRHLIEARSRLVDAETNRDLAFARLEQALGQDAPGRDITKAFLASHPLELTNPAEDSPNSGDAKETRP